MAARYAAGTVKKNRELTVTGPYHTPATRSTWLHADCRRLAVALLSWPVPGTRRGLYGDYVPVIASEERFLRATFPASTTIAGGCRG